MFAEVIKALVKENSKLMSQTKFCIEYTLDPNDFEINVNSLGKLNLPLDQKTIEKLLNLSSQAKFGRGEKTLSDLKIRNTQEIAASQLQINFKQDGLKHILETIQNSLGLPKNTSIKAHLHNMLIYGPGQFFKEHQDSEKLDGMIATLVLVLPSPHIGGNLIIRHKKEQAQFVSENINSQELKGIAFYADCHHEVKKVKQGYRVALTYNLVLEPSKIQLNEYVNTDLEHALKNYFSAEDSESEPRNLVYFLDHSYTEHSLRWDRLKGADCLNALAFLSAANKLNLLPHLALVEIHETWSTDGDDYDPSPEELIDESIVLSHWIDENNKRLDYQDYYVADEEICWTTKTEDLEPDQTEYEGWMGNYGNTADYWYRRAAVVLWKKSSQITMHFNLDYKAAIQSLLRLTDHSGHEEEALEIIKKAGNYLHKHASDYTVSDFESFAKIALYIQDENIAESILSKFNLSIIQPDSVRRIVELQNKYGTMWVQKLITLWNNNYINKSYYNIQLLDNLDYFAQDFLASKGNENILRLLIEYQIDLLIENDKKNKNARPRDLKKIRDQRIKQIKVLIITISKLQNDNLTEMIIKHMISNAWLYPAFDLVNIIFEFKNHNKENVVWYDVLSNYVINTLKQELDLGLRSQDDKSINSELPCRCEYCKTAEKFLKSKLESQKIWPLAQQYRDHIIEKFDGLELPVSLTVEKKGSPYKLVMIKDKNLYQIAKRRFDRLSEYCKKLCNEDAHCVI